ncbi:MAG: hypothetical protein M1133_05535 [Armatimonadetes bacterium]|nr:hypothetical protein [Armatimonadota bacterium]
MRTVIWIVLPAIVLGYVIYAFATVNRVGDETQLRALFADATTAVQKRDLSGAISHVSPYYKDDSGMNYDRLRMLCAQALRIETQYNTETTIKSLTINGDKATAEARFVVTPQAGRSHLYARDVTVYLAKEDAWHALIIPTKVWRVTRIESLGLNPQEGF